jgi:hypothetical protein
MSDTLQFVDVERERRCSPSMSVSHPDDKLKRIEHKIGLL